MPTAKPGSDKPQARGIWLTDTLLQWPLPAADPSGPVHRYVLAHSQRGGISLRGNRITGAETIHALAVDSSAAASQAAAHAPWVARFGGATQTPALRLSGLSAPQIRALHQGQLVLLAIDSKGGVIRHTETQTARALDALHAKTAVGAALGANLLATGQGSAAQFKLWAPTASQVSVCLYPASGGAANGVHALSRDRASGVWATSVKLPESATGAIPAVTHNYTYLVDVWVPGLGWVRNRVTDPYSLSLNANSKRSAIIDLNDPRLAPKGWAQRNASGAADRVKANTDMVIYELHVRDFSANDPSVPEALRGKFGAFTQAQSNGMRHLKALSDAGMTDVHLLPIFDISSIPEQGCVSPGISVVDSPTSTVPQAAVAAVREKDCFNWGYDPLHYTAPEGSYASLADDPAARILEMRQMIMAINAIGMRVGMDVVYNHTPASGQDDKSVLDRIVPNYYQRLNAVGGVETSTCCANTATEHAMMAKLMLDSAEVWVKHHGVQSFRFDLMGHQPRAVMERLRDRLNRVAGREVQLIGEGWNFGEVENSARFVQASQLSLNGSGIGTFSDRTRDAVRGGGWSDNGEQLLAKQGWANGLHVDPTTQARAVLTTTAADLARSADMVRVGLAGSLSGYAFTTHQGATQTLAQIRYGDSPAGYASQPGEVVNYVDNHDNPSLFDINAFKLPAGTLPEDRARAQVVGIAVTALSQGVAYFHAGVETLRSKSLDRNSYDSGDWFNRIDWTLNDNYFATGLPPEQDNGNNWSVMRPVLANPLIKPRPQDIRFTRDATLDLLKIRASSTLFRMKRAQDVTQRLQFHNTGPAQIGSVVVAELDGQGFAGANFARIVYAINADPAPQRISLPSLKGQPLVLHPVHRSANAADRRAAATAQFDAASGNLTVPARSAVVWVQE